MTNYKVLCQLQLGDRVLAPNTLVTSEKLDKAGLGSDDVAYLVKTAGAIEEVSIEPPGADPAAPPPHDKTFDFDPVKLEGLEETALRAMLIEKVPDLAEEIATYEKEACIQMLSSEFEPAS